MRRSRREMDEWADRLASGKTDDGTEAAAFVEGLRSSSVHAQTPDDSFVGMLAAEATEAAENLPTSTTKPVDRPARLLIPRWRRRVMLGTLLSTLFGKLVLGGAAVAVAASGMAATGTLPAPAQQWAADTLDAVGVELPNPDARPDLSETATMPALPDELMDRSEPPTAALEARESTAAAERQAPSLPASASPVAKAVVGKVFSGDPADGSEYGKGIAATASAGAADAAETGEPSSSVPDEAPEAAGVPDEAPEAADVPEDDPVTPAPADQGGEPDAPPADVQPESVPAEAIPDSAPVPPSTP